MELAAEARCQASAPRIVNDDHGADFRGLYNCFGFAAILYTLHHPLD